MGKRIIKVSGELPGWSFLCPGCHCGHMINTDKPVPGKTWTLTGNEDFPTISPSVLMDRPGRRCHSYVTAGRIQFLNDCDHALAGQTVELPYWDAPLEQG
jgi:hypothetical protein